MSAQANHTVWSAYLSASTGTVAVGSVMIPDVDGDYYVIATSAARTAAVRTSCAGGVAITAGDSTNRSVELQTVGPCPPSITGLGAGLAGPIIVSATGTLERKVTPTTSDIVMGKCDADGWAYLNVSGGTPGTGSPGGSSKQLQYNLTATTFGGLPWTYEGAPAGVAEVRAENSSRQTVTRYLTASQYDVWSAYAYEADPVFGDYEVLSIGGDGAGSAASMPDVFRTYGRSVQLQQAGRSADADWSLFFLARPIGTSTGTGLGIFPNFLVRGTTFDALSAANDFGTGKGVIGLKEAATNPSTNPTLGVVIFNKAADGEVYYRKKDGTERPMYGGLPTGASTEIQTRSGDTFLGATNVKAGSGYLSIGATPGSSGQLRLTSSGILIGVAGTTAMEVSGGTMRFGATSGAPTYVELVGGTASYMGYGAAPGIFQVDASGSHLNHSTHERVYDSGTQGKLKGVWAETTNATPANVQTITPVEDKPMTVECRVTAGKQAGGGAASIWFVRKIYKDGGAITLGARTTIHSEVDAGIAGAAADLVVSGSDVVLQVTGVAATTIEWATRVDYDLVNAT